jgi:hypothetical protein
MLSLFGKYKKTNFNGGGVIAYRTPLCAMEECRVLKTAEQFQAPRKIDNRDMCLASNNQLQTPRCVGYSVAGYCEFQHWKTEHFPQQLDADAIYLKAKTIDGIPNENGTYPWAAIKAAVSLNMIKGEGKTIQPTKLDVQFAIHQYGVCIGAFMITDDWNYVERKTGIIRNTPDAKKRGGHAILCVGYNSDGLMIENSWGSEWGNFGFAVLSWAQFSTQIMNAMVIV